MHIAQLLNPFLLGPDVEVVITRLPEWSACDRARQNACNVLLQHLNGRAETAAFRFAH